MGADMNAVYTDLAEAWDYLKKGKEGTCFLYVKPAKPADPPWIFIGKRSIVRQRAKKSHLAAASDFYILTKAVTGTLHRDGQTLVLVPDEEKTVGELSAWSQKAGTALLRAANNAKKGEAAKAASSVRKLAIAFKSVEVRAALDGAAAEADQAQLDEYDDGTDAAEEQELADELRTALAPDDMARAFGSEAVSVTDALAEAGAALEAILQAQDETERSDGFSDLFEALGDDLSLDSAATLLASASVQQPISSSRVLGEGQKPDNDQIAALCRIEVNGVRGCLAQHGTALDQALAHRDAAARLRDDHETWSLANPGSGDSETRLDTLAEQLAELQRETDLLFVQMERLEDAAEDHLGSLRTLLGR